MILPKTYFNWSSGKDASLALHTMLQSGQFNIDKLLTSINTHHNKVSMHGLRRELLEAQVQSIGIPLQTIELPEEPSMDDYNRIMTDTVKDLQGKGYTDCGFGDIFLEDLRQYREEQLAPFDILPHFPLWKKDTKDIASDFIKKGFKAIVICTNSELLGQSFVGREFNQDFIKDLPNGVDPCGENGEFHTFCYNGPIFNKAVEFDIGETVYRAYKAPKNNENASNMGFWFCDLITSRYREIS